MTSLIDPRVLVDAGTGDDAGVYRLTDDRALVATVDFFAPVVDDAYDFGRIAAANAFSDVYAMGATPLFALNLVGWPRDTLPLDLLGDVLRGGQDIAREAGAFVLGGHTVDDPEPKYGMAVIGEAHPDRVVTISGAKAGDRLVLTKPIGAGVLTTARKRDLLSESDLEPAVTVMAMLNAAASQAMLAAGAHAATDVTGFGLLGHLHNMARASGVHAEINADAVPLLPHARAAVERGAVPGGTRRNMESVAPWVRYAPSVQEIDRVLLCDAMTSGGLLIAVPDSAVDTLIRELERHGTPAAALIGQVSGGQPGGVTVR